MMKMTMEIAIFEDDNHITGAYIIKDNEIDEEDDDDNHNNEYKKWWRLSDNIKW